MERVVIAYLIFYECLPSIIIPHITATETMVAYQSFKQMRACINNSIA